MGKSTEMHAEGLCPIQQSLKGVIQAEFCKMKRGEARKERVGKAHPVLWLSCGPRTSSVGMPWELVRNADSLVPSRVQNQNLCVRVQHSGGV